MKHTKQSKRTVLKTASTIAVAGFTRHWIKPVALTLALAKALTRHKEAGIAPAFL